MKQSFRVIPVLDVKGGLAVHAIAGKREEYQPVKSWLHPAPDPVSLSKAFEAAYGFKELYLADLDAITGKASLNLSLLSEISSITSLRLMVDGGFRRLEDAESTLKAGASKAVFGTETLPSLSLLKEALERFSPSKVTVSLDLSEGRIIGLSRPFKGLKPWEAAGRLSRLGVEELIVLDLSRVGVERGIDLKLTGSIVKAFNGEVLVGGGVRGLEDLEDLAELGAAGALVATVLHKGRIKPEELLEKRFQA
ncbi:MAG: HisA/HisF-related TIM barrel protein [Candidatus Hecatellaceae archaeon]|nr:MAG: hisA/hisF family protein [Candidatus Hecatellales archaeon]